MKTTSYYYKNDELLQEKYMQGLKEYEENKKHILEYDFKLKKYIKVNN